VGIGGEILDVPEPGRFRIQMEDGRVLDVSLQPGTEQQALRVSLLCGIPDRRFDGCPICGESATDAEHVPPASVGGRPRTYTCAACNQVLGSLAEADLGAWHDHRLVSVRFQHDAVRGSRRVAPVRLRTTPDGGFVLVVTGGDRGAIRDMLDAGGEMQMEFAEPDPHRYQVALLKHAYLAACLHLGKVPEGAASDDVRAELIAIRDSADRHDLPAAPISASLDYGRSYEPTDGALHIGSLDDSDGNAVLKIVMGAIVVSWPLNDQDSIDTAWRVATQRRAAGRVGSCSPRRPGPLR
jgi:hypothetical protein